MTPVVPVTAPPTTGGPYTASAVFSMSGVSGVISFSQATALSPTMLRISLAGLNGLGQQFHVHVSPTQRSSADPCGPAATGGHFNPLNVPAGACSPATPNLCEMGDLSGKHGELLNLVTADWTKYDSYLPLSGTNSIIGRSVVIHKPDGSRWVCADISGASSTVAPSAPLGCTDQNSLCSAWKAAGDRERSQALRSFALSLLRVAPNEALVAGECTSASKSYVQATCPASCGVCSVCPFFRRPGLQCTALR